MIAVGGESKNVLIYNLIEEKPIHIEEGFNDYVENIVSTEAYMAVGTLNGEVVMYEYKIIKEEKKEGTIVIKKEEKIELKKINTLVINSGVSKMKFLSDKKLFIFTLDGKSILYDMKTIKILIEKRYHSKNITYIKFKDWFIFTSSLDAKLKVLTDKLILISSFSLGDPMLTFD